MLNSLHLIFNIKIDPLFPVFINNSPPNLFQINEDTFNPIHAKYVDCFISKLF